MNASTRVVTRCHDKITDVCDLAATRTALISILVAVPVAVGAYALLDRFASMPEVFRVVAAVLVLLLGISLGSLAIGRYLRQKPQDYDETRGRLIPYLAKKDAVVGDAWKTFLSKPQNCPPSVRRRAWRKVCELDRLGYPGFIEKPGPGVGKVFLALGLSVAASLLIFVGVHHFDAVSSSKAEVSAAVAVEYVSANGDPKKTAKLVSDHLGLGAEKAKQLDAAYQAALKDAPNAPPAQKLEALIDITRKAVPPKEKPLPVLEEDPSPTLTLALFLAGGVLLTILALTLGAQALSSRIHASGLNQLEDKEERKRKETASEKTPEKTNGTRVGEPSANGRAHAPVASA